MDLSKSSIGYDVTIKSEPMTDEENERYEDLLHTQNSDILLPRTEKQTYQYLMSDFVQFERLKVEPLNIKSEAIENETEILVKSFPSIEEFSNKNTEYLEIKSEHIPDENDLLFCAEILDASSSDVEDTSNKSEQLPNGRESSELLEIPEESIDLSYTGIDISYPDIKKECAGKKFIHICFYTYAQYL